MRIKNKVIFILLLLIFSLGMFTACNEDTCDHSGGVATCKHRANCDNCGKEYGKLGDHSGGIATCKHRANCDNCGKEYGKLGDHNGGIATCIEKAVCDDCDEKYGELDLSNHRGGIATCTHKAVCDDCHNEYGEIDTTKHRGGNATCTQKATCDDCSKAYGVLDGNNHSFEANKCISCGFIEIAPASSFEYMIKNGGVIITGYTGISRAILSIPQIIEGKFVIGIDDSAFQNSSFQNVIIPDCVQDIGASAFRNCRNLTSITIGTGVLSIGDYALYGCDNLISIVLGKNVQSIGDNMLSLGKGFKKIYYMGSYSDWARLGWNEFDNFAYAYYYSETSKGTGYWHYNDDGEIEEW